MKVPVVRPVAWLALFVLVGMMGLMSFIIALVFRIHQFPVAVFCGMVAYLITFRISRAIALYEHALREFPDSGMAITALNMLRSAQTLPPIGENT